MKEENKRKSLILMTIGVLTLLIVVAGATYAFFQAQTGDGQSTNANVATGTTDNLTFTIADIDVTEPTDGQDKNIIDNHNKVSGEAENAELVINANQNNFGQSGTSLGDGVEAVATLKANDTTKTATAKYNVFLVLDQNDLEYTINETNPELILTVHEPGKVDEYTSILTNLEHHEKDESNAKDIGGYDITGKREVIQIAKDYEINANEEIGLTTSQTWKIQVTLVNLDQNQNINTGKSITGKVVITTEEEIELPTLNTLSLTRTEDSIIATAITNKEENIEEYYFGIEEASKQSNNFSDYEAKDETNSHTFNEISADKEYIIHSYAVDSNGYKTNEYKTEVKVETANLPSITNVEITETTFNSIKVNVFGSGELTNYKFIIDDGREPITQTGAEYLFEGLEELTKYTITIVGINGENSTIPYVVEATTPKHITYADICDEKSNSCQVAKKLVADSGKDTLLYHDGTIKDEAGNVLDAEDYSYRYAGAKYKITSKHLKEYSKIDDDLIKFNCNSENVIVDSYCDPSYTHFYYLDYKPGEQFASYASAVIQALKDGYIEGNVNNYVCFGGDCSIDPNDSEKYSNLFKIIGMFPTEETKANENKTYQLKIIKADYTTETETGGVGVGAGTALHPTNSTNANHYKVDSKYLDKVMVYKWNTTSNNNWKESILNTVNLNGTYLNYIKNKENEKWPKWSSMIEEHEWITAGNTWENIGLQNVKTAYTNEIIKPIVGTALPTAAKTVPAKIGLVYMSDYLYGASKEYWHLIGNDHPNSVNDYRKARDDNWLFMGLYEWTITRQSDVLNKAFDIHPGGAPEAIGFGRAVIRPTMYLNSDVKIVSGTGAPTDPYIISE